MANLLRFMAICIIVSPFIMFGCEKALFPDGTQRTPYERYQVLHGEYRPAKEINAYGGEQPALRQRLRPLYSP